MAGRPEAGPWILVLAAGVSSRMAPRDKLLQPVDGVPLLKDRALAAIATGAPVAVALPLDRPERNAALAVLPVLPITVRDAARGMGRSIAAGARALRGAAGLMVVPGDAPDLTADHMRLLLEAGRADPHGIHQGASAGRFGHPVLFPADLLDELEALDGDEGGRSILRRHAGRVRLHELPGGAATTDLDTPEDWLRWRARTGR